MKKLLLIIGLWCIENNLLGEGQNLAHSAQQKMYHHVKVGTFIAQGVLYCVFVLPWWADLEKINSAAMRCEHCGKVTTSLQMYHELLVRYEPNKIMELKSAWADATANEIAALIARWACELRYTCAGCTLSGKYVSIFD